MKTVLVSATFSKSLEELRFNLALQTCDAAAARGYPLIIVDGSPNEAVSQCLREHGATVHKQTQPGMGASRRQALQAGLDTGADTIVWLEPEKYPFVPHIGPCVSKLASSTYEIISPTRRSLESYPQYQELSELRANREIGFITGRPELDLMFGPRVMKRSGAELLMSYTGQTGDNWQILFIPILWALTRGIHIGDQMVDYIHPPEQTAAEVGDKEMDKKRDVQRQDLVTAMRNEAIRLGMLIEN